MELNLVDAILEQVSPSIVSTVAESTAETPSNARAALNTSAVAIASGLVRHGSTRAGAATMLPLLRAPTLSGNGLVAALLGSSADELVGEVMRSASVSRSTASGVVTVIFPLAAAVLRREVTSRSLDADGLAELLSSQAAHVETTPANVGKHVGSHQGKLTPITATPRGTAVPPKRSWLPLVTTAVLGALLLTMLVARISRRSGPPTEHTGQATVTAASLDDLSARFAGTAALPDRVTLPGVSFHVGSTAMAEGGAASVERLAELMSRYPHSRVRLEGHSDAAPGSDLGPRLSAQRAGAVRQMLIERGIDGARIDIGTAQDIGRDARAGSVRGRGIDIVIVER